jgi:transposase-like protein
MDLSLAVYNRDLKMRDARAERGATKGEIARKYQVSPHLLERWRSEWRAKGDLAFPRIGRCGAALPAIHDTRRIAELERKVVQMTMENDFLKNSLAVFQGSSPASRRQWRGSLFEEVRGARDERPSRERLVSDDQAEPVRIL